MTHNEHDHGVPTEALFYLLRKEGRVPFESADAAIAAYRTGDILMCELPKDDNEHIIAGRAT